MNVIVVSALRDTECNPHYHDPVCDTEGREHTNACLMLQRDRKPAHRGHCQVTVNQCGGILYKCHISMVVYQPLNEHHCDYRAVDVSLQTDCGATSPVCGHDGETYADECEATAARVTVDYHAPCRTVGFFSGQSHRRSSTRVPATALSYRQQVQRPMLCKLRFLC